MDKINYANLFSLRDKVAIVTGASRGLGRAIAEALLRAHATVMLVATSRDKLENATLEFCSRNLLANYFICDLTDSEQVLNLVDHVGSRFGKIDILVNNAGVTSGGSLFDYSDKDWERTYKVNLKAPFELSRATARMMQNSGSGSIINITSINAELAFPNNPAYVTFKGALKQLTKSLAVDLGKYNIRVNSIGPGYFKTDMTKKSWENLERRKQIEEKTVLGRWGNPEDLAGTAIFLASDASSYITGQDIYVDGGWLIKGF